MSKKYFCLIAVLLAFTSGGLLLCSVPASAIAALPESSHISNAGTTLTVEAQSNTTEAKRLELRRAIDQSGPKGSRKTGEAITELIKIENPDDIIYLLGMMNKNKETPLEVQIKKAILAYPNNTFIAIALKKAGQDFNADINIIAANLLIDKGEKEPGLKIVPALIKKGVMTDQVIAIMERVPDRLKLDGYKRENGDEIFSGAVLQEFRTVIGTPALPAEVQMFAILMVYAYYDGGDFSGRGIAEVIENANPDYQMKAIYLLKKILESYKGYPNTPWETFKELAKSKDAQIAEIARKTDAEMSSKELTDAKSIIEKAAKADYNETSQNIYDFLKQFGDTPENVAFLCSILKKAKWEGDRQTVLEAFNYSKQNAIILPALQERARVDPSLTVRSVAVKILAYKQYQQEAFQLLPAIIEAANKQKEALDVDLLFIFTKVPIKMEFLDYIKKITNQKYKPYIRALAKAITGEPVKPNLKLYKSVLENEKSVKLLWKLGDAVSQTRSENELVEFLNMARETNISYIAEEAEKRLKQLQEKGDFPKDQKRK